MENKYHTGKKTLWEKEKLFVTSNSFFPHVFHSYISLVQVCQKAVFWSNGLNRKAKLKLYQVFYEEGSLYISWSVHLQWKILSTKKNILDLIQYESAIILYNLIPKL